jgi:hypothetical protein
MEVRFDSDPDPFYFYKFSLFENLAVAAKTFYDFDRYLDFFVSL